jgi:hypothetical protein
MVEYMGGAGTPGGLAHISDMSNFQCNTLIHPLHIYHDVGSLCIVKDNACTKSDLMALVKLSPSISICIPYLELNFAF